MLLALTALVATVGSLACAGEAAAPTSVSQPGEGADIRRVAALAVTPAAITLDSGATHHLVANARDAQGRTIGNAVIAWTSGDTLIARVTATGVVTALRPGAATVTARANDVTDTARVTVPAPPVEPTPVPAPPVDSTPAPPPAPTPVPPVDSTPVTPTPTPSPPPVDSTPAPAPAPIDIIFADDFESGTLDRWHDGVNPTKHRVVTDGARAAGGTRFLEITYPAGGEGGWLTRFFMPGHDSIYVRYDVFFDASWRGGTKLLNLRGSRTDDQWSSFGKAGQCPDGSEWFATNVVLLSEQDPGPIRFYSYHPGMPRESDGVTCWGRHSGMGITNYTGDAAIARGAWHRVEFWVRLNTPGQANGAQRVWIDGTLRGEWTGLVLRTTTQLKLNSLTLEASLMGPAQSFARRLLVDNVVVARGRSGT